MSRKILILGGSGNLGMPLARYLIKEARDIELILAGRNEGRAQNAASTIQNETGFQAISGVRVDAANLEMLKDLFQDVDLVIVVSSTIDLVENVVKAAINTGTDYLDAQLSSIQKLDYLRSQEQKIIEKGRIFITDGGFHPGLLAAIVRWADTRVGPLHEANIFGALKIDWASLQVSEGTVEEMLEEFRYYDMSILQEGKWTKPGYTFSIKHDFSEPLMEQSCVPMLLEELRMLPTLMPELREAGFYVTGFNRFFDIVVLPVLMLALALGLKKIAAWLFRFGLSFSKPPYVVQLDTICKGENGEIRISITDEDGYILTAIPIVACINQYLDGTINKPGLYWQAWVVEPEKYFEDLRRMGLNIRVNS